MSDFPITSRKRTSVTLLDLAVILAIVAVLTAALFPVFARAGQIMEAGQPNCLGNLEHLGKALKLYMHDNDETVPLLSGSSSGTNGSEVVTWQDTIQPYLHTYRFCFDPANGASGSLIPGSTSTHAYLDYATNYGILGNIEYGDAISGRVGQNASWLTRTKPWLQRFVPANIAYDGMGGSADEGGWFSGVPIIPPVPSYAVASAARPNEYAFVFCAGNFDGWNGSLGTAPFGFGYCGTWTTVSGGTDFTFVGPNPFHRAGQPINECDQSLADRGFGKGVANILFLDGHASDVSGRMLMRLTPDRTHLLHFTLGQ